MVLSNGFWPFPLHSAHSLPLLIPLFPSVPALSVVKHVVKEPFLTRCSIRCRHLSRRALFHVQVWGIVPLQRLRSKRFFESGVSIFNMPIQRIGGGGYSASHPHIVFVLWRFSPSPNNSGLLIMTRSSRGHQHLFQFYQVFVVDGSLQSVIYIAQ